MALNKDSVKKAISILKIINENANVVKYEIYDKSTSYVDTNKIYCAGEKSDDGYDNIFTNIENMTNEQLQLWDQLKEEVPNSSFISALEEKDCSSSVQWEEHKNKNITCIGWF